MAIHKTNEIEPLGSIVQLNPLCYDDLIPEICLVLLALQNFTSMPYFSE